MSAHQLAWSIQWCAEGCTALAPGNRYLPFPLVSWWRCAALQGRALPAEQVLPLLRKHSAALTCQYLEYLVVGRGGQQPEHHTELALSFASAALELMPPVDDRYIFSPSLLGSC